MKKLNFELFVAAVGCILAGVATLGVSCLAYTRWQTIPRFMPNPDTVRLLKELYSECQFMLVPGLGAVFLIIGVLLLLNFFKRRRLGHV